MMPVKQAFLLKPKVNKKPTGDVPLAEDYLAGAVNESSAWLLEVIKRIFNILDHLTIDEHGKITELRNLVTYNGVTYQGIEDYFKYDPKHPDKKIHYSILKKLNAGNNSYEIRFGDKTYRGMEEFRIILTVHKKLNILVLTHGFSKKREISDYYGIGTANEVTTQLGRVASELYVILNDEINGLRATDSYLGKEGERHEVRL